MNASLRTMAVTGLGLMIVTSCLVSASARRSDRFSPQTTQILENSAALPVGLDQPPPVGRWLNATAAPETTVLGSWTFDGCGAEGWTSVDWTAQHGDFWHVDDFAGLGGGDFGRLVPIEGLQSMWCGARAGVDEILCQYASLPGYGNSWDQRFRTVDCLDVTGDVTVDFLMSWDTEADYDSVWVEYDLCDDNWKRLTAVDGIGSDAFSLVVPAAMHSGQVGIRFDFVSDGGYSDEDGLNDTDGAAILDSLTVSDGSGIVLPTELFEAESPGDHATLSGNWTSEPRPGYGHFAGLFSGSDVLQEDPCVRNLSCMWGFFSGSTHDYDCGGHPGQAVVPYGNEDGLYIRNDVWSPWFAFDGSGSSVELRFDLYRDMAYDALIFYMWEVRGMSGGCPSTWQDRASVGGYGAQKDWIRMNLEVGDLVSASSTHMQVGLGVADMCFVWCGSVGSGACHSHAPLFDNVEVVRIDSKGPVWWTREGDFFQDNFPADGTATGTVRADIARDILPANNPNIRPGDSTRVTVSDPEAGLAADAYTGFGSAVYAYVGVWPQGQAGKGGDALTEDAFRWPVVDSLLHGGDRWYCLRMDTAFTNSVARSGPQPDAFCVDLNDNLFTPGDTVCYVFAATSDAPVNVTRYYSLHTGPTDDLDEALDNPMEFTCLPTGDADILYVDDFDGLGAQPFFDTAFDVLGIADRVDRYDVGGAASTVGSGPGSRVVDVSQQLLPFYRTIVWNSGDLDHGTIGDGSYGSQSVLEKCDDFGMLYDFIDNLASEGGLYISGDNLADEWDGLSAANAVNLRTDYINFTVLDGDHQNAGQPVSPLVFGETGLCFDGDTLVAYGGCPGLNAFDVLGALGDAVVEASYSAIASNAGAVVGQTTTNSQAIDVGVILSGFSFHQIRDLEPAGIPARADHVHDILTCLGVSGGTPTDARPAAYRNALAQNYPNPFNPTTTIEFTVVEKTRATIRVYNVAGQLVMTLADGERAPGVVHRVEWDGRNAAGQSVASGVYFYRLVTKDYTQTRKMVVLK